jgi:hypothetical protein
MESPSEAEVAAPGRKITAALVMRVAGRLETGLPLKVALAGEGVAVDAYMQHLREHSKLEAVHETAKRKFMERAVNAMLEEVKPAASYRWLLEHCHPDLLAQPGDAGSAAALQTIAGLPNELLERMREYAKNAK